MANGMNIRRRWRKNIPVWLIAAAVILAILSVVIGASAFFRVSEISVNGNSKYTNETIVEASGLKTGTRIYAVKPSQAELNISQKLFYVDRVEVKIVYPNRIEISVLESHPIASVFHSGDWCIIDENCRLLEYGTNTSAHSYIVMTGIEIEKSELGSVISVSEEDELRIKRITEVLNAVYDAHLENSITALDISDLGNILLTYGENITVKIGSGQNVLDKLMLLSEISDKLDMDQIGTVQLGENGQAYYTKH